MKPLNIDNTGCTNISSNCVIWQGPDIPCINLCKGDSVTDVVYKLATELCTLMTTFDLNSYDLDCFQKGVCQPTDFQSFMQLLINKVCALESCSPCAYSCVPDCAPVTAAASYAVTATGGSDTIVNINPAFYYKNQFGDTVTTMPLSDYVTTIGNKVATQITTISGIQAALADQNRRLTELENAPVPTVELPFITPTGVLPKTPTEITAVVQAMEAQFVQLRNATGTPNEIYTGIQKQPGSLNNSPTLSSPKSTMSSLSGWASNVVNEADSVGNMWLTIMDIRNALQNMINNYVPTECSSISLSMLATYSSSTIVLYINGTIPSTFVNTYALGTSFTISDVYGNSITQNIDIKSIINNVSGYNIPIGGTLLNPSGNLTISAEPSFTSKSSGSQCMSILQYTIVNVSSCPPVSYTPSRDAIEYAFTTDSGSKIYNVELWTETGSSPISTQSFTSTAVNNITSSFVELTSATAYKVRVTVEINGVITTCPFTAITTL
jgi:hypothetical protein